jgi:hypothetical protein
MDYGIKKNTEMKRNETERNRTKRKKQLLTPDCIAYLIFVILQPS